jgi:homoserine kinase type II
MEFEKIKNLLQKSYGINALEIEPINKGVVNKKYRIKDDEGTYILKRCKSRSIKKIENIISFTEFAKGHSFATFSIIPTPSGSKYIHYNSRYYYMMTTVPGEPVPPFSNNSKVIYSLGKTMADLHLLQWKPPNKIKSRTLKNISTLWNKVLPNLESATFKDKQHLINVVTDELLYQQKIHNIYDSLPKSVTHSDSWFENIMTDGNKVVGIVDLDNISVDVSLVDLARTLNTWCFSDEKINDELASKFINGYTEKRKLTQVEIDNLTNYVRFIALRHVIYVADFYLRGKLDNPAEGVDFKSLLFWRQNPNYFKNYFAAKQS